MAQLDQLIDDDEQPTWGNTQLTGDADQADLSLPGVGWVTVQSSTNSITPQLGGGGFSRRVYYSTARATGLVSRDMFNVHQPFGRNVMRRLTDKDVMVTLDQSGRAGIELRNVIFTAVTLRAPDRVPAWREGIDVSIRASAWIAGLGDDWDGLGSHAMSQETWSRTVRVLTALAERAITLGMALPNVSIAPNGHGSIDLFWDGNDRSVLLNVPADANEAPSYSSTRNGALEAAGYLDSVSKQDSIIQFLNS